MLAVTLAAVTAAVAPAPAPTVAAQAQLLGRRVAEAGDFQAIIATVAQAQSNELVRAHPELAPEDRKALLATARARFLAEREVLLDKLGEIYAGYFTLPELRAIAAFFASPAGKRYTGRLGTTAPAMAAALGKLDFKGDVIKDFCAKTGKACPPTAP